MQRVLVVEDCAVLAMLLEQVLSVEGFSVIGPVGDISSALEIAHSSDLEMAILDVNLCGTPIHPVARALAKRHVPFLFVTAYDREIVEPEFSDRVVLRKPIDVSQVSAELRQLVNSSPLL